MGAMVRGVVGVVCAGVVSWFAPNSANAQTVDLPTIDVTSTRLTPRARPAPSREGSGAPGAPAAEPASSDNADVANGIGGGIAGTSTTFITAEQIARSPAENLAEILAREPGIQVTNPFGMVNGARSVVDMRGFGATASSNTLVLINGRRLKDLDIVGVDLAAIPRDSIAQIEITRGNSGAVLYGEGAVGGVINIVTKSPVGIPNSARVDGVVGSFNYREGIASAAGSSGPWSASVYSNAINSDGYRVNNFYRQLNGIFDLRYSRPEGSFYLSTSTDTSWLGLPGARRVDPVAGLDQLATDRTGATTPFDWASKNGLGVTMGVTRHIAPGAELILDGGVRTKHEQLQSFFATATFATMDPRAAVDTVMTTASITPRINLSSAVQGMPWRATGGIDFYHTEYASDRPLALGFAPINHYDMKQSSVAGYWQNTLTVLPSTDVSAGARVQWHHLDASGTFDASAPGGTSCFPGFGCFVNGVPPVPLDTSETNQAYHLGVEHRFNPVLTAFGRMAQSFRVPNVDERVGMVTAGGFDPTTFRLKTQHSRDVEAGLRVRLGRLDVQTSVYDMRLTDEILFRYGPNFEANNINLDPTRRYGSETIAAYRVNDRLRFRGGFAYTRAVFREGLFAGNDVPLVSRWTGNVGASWDIVAKALQLDATLRYVGARRMDNDQTNVQPLIPAAAVADIKIGGQTDRYFYSLAVQNLFDVKYFDYAIASPYPYGPGSQLNTYNAYPLPGRTFLFRVGAKLL